MLAYSPAATENIMGDILIFQKKMLSLRLDKGVPGVAEIIPSNLMQLVLP